MDKKTWGTKRTCANCAAHFYDLNRGSGVCPKCDAPFDPQATTKRKRVRAAVEAKAPEARIEAPESPQPALEPVKDTETVAETTANGDGRAAADSPEKLEDIDESDDDDDDDSLIEDASELGEDSDDVADVIGKVKDDEGRA